MLSKKLKKTVNTGIITITEIKKLLKYQILKVLIYIFKSWKLRCVHYKGDLEVDTN